jgi:hypothetical protein
MLRADIPGHSLHFDDRPARGDSDRDAVIFIGRNAMREVICAISGEALEDHFDADGVADQSRIKLFQRHRAEIENMARIKYLTWPVEEPDAVLVKTADVPALRAALKKSDRLVKSVQPKRPSKR